MSFASNCGSVDGFRGMPHDAVGDVGLIQYRAPVRERLGRKDSVEYFGQLGRIALRAPSHQQTGRPRSDPGGQLLLRTLANLSTAQRCRNQCSSDVRYTLRIAFGGFNRSCSGKKLAPHRAAWIYIEQDQAPSATSEVVTCEPFPVRSRR